MFRMRAMKLGAAVVAGAFLLTGCGAAGADTPKPSAAPSLPSLENASGEVAFWSSVTNMQPVVDEFNKTHPNIKVTYSVVPSGTAGGYAKLSTALQAGNAPDVATIEYPYLSGYASAGNLKPISDYVGEDVLGKFPGQITDLVKLGGKSWAMPYDAPPMAFYYRTDVLAEAGVAKAPATWDEFEAAGKALKAKNPNAYLASFYPNDANVLAGLAWQGGGKWFGVEGDSWKVTMDDPATAKVAQFWQRMVDQKIVKVEQAFSDEWSQDLQQSNVVGVVGASWSATGIISRTKGQEGKWAVAELPNWGKPANAMLGGSTFAITKDSKNPEAAAVFTQWMSTSQDAVKARGNSGSAWLAYPGLSDIAKNAFDASHFGGQDIYSVYQKASDAVLPGWNWGPDIASTLTPLHDGLGKITTGQTIEDTIKQADKSTTDALKSRGLSVTD